MLGHFLGRALRPRVRLSYNTFWVKRCGQDSISIYKCHPTLIILLIKRGSEVFPTSHTFEGWSSASTYFVTETISMSTQIYIFYTGSNILSFISSVLLHYSIYSRTQIRSVLNLTPYRSRDMELLMDSTRILYIFWSVSRLSWQEVEMVSFSSYHLRL